MWLLVPLVCWVNFTKAVDACGGVRNARGELHGAPRDWNTRREVYYNSCPSLKSKECGYMVYILARVLHFHLDLSFRSLASVKQEAVKLVVDQFLTAWLAECQAHSQPVSDSLIWVDLSTHTILGDRPFQLAYLGVPVSPNMECQLIFPHLAL